MKAKGKAGSPVMALFRCAVKAKAVTNANSLFHDYRQTENYHLRLCAHVKCGGGGLFDKCRKSKKRKNVVRAG